MNTKLPKAVIFDWDNTLVDSWPLIHHAINTTMGAMDQELWSEQKVKTNIHKSMREFFPTLFGDRWEEAGEIYSNSYRSQHLEKLQFLPGAIELIDFLLAKEIVLFVISNKMGDTLRLEANNLKVADKFLSLVGSRDASLDKPHKDVVDLALKNSRLDPDKDLVWFVGDTITDIECAIISHCQPILYGDGKNVPKGLMAVQMTKAKKPMLQFNNHQEILRMLQNL